MAEEKPRDSRALANAIKGEFMNKDKQKIDSEILKVLKNMLISVETLMLVVTLNFSYIGSEDYKYADYYRGVIVFILVVYFYLRLKHQKN